MSREGNPQIKEYGRKTRYKSIGNFKEKMHPRSFTIRLPFSAAEKILAMPKETRLKFMRDTLLEKLEYEKPKTEDNAA